MPGQRSLPSITCHPREMDNSIIIDAHLLVQRFGLLEWVALGCSELSVGEDKAGKEGEGGIAVAMAIHHDDAGRRGRQLKRCKLMQCALALRLTAALPPRYAWLSP